MALKCFWNIQIAGPETEHDPGCMSGRREQKLASTILAEICHFVESLLPVTASELRAVRTEKRSRIATREETTGLKKGRLLV